MQPLDAACLARGARSRILKGVNGLDVHLLEAGYPTAGEPNRPLVLLLHGFPELAFSWRKLLLPLADAGFHVVAPDQRGYGRTTGWEPAEGSKVGHRVIDWVCDAVALVAALGYRQASVVGHDFGAQIAGFCALMRPDVFRSVTMMSSPFTGAPPWPAIEAANPGEGSPASVDVHEALAGLEEPRKHYQAYFATDAAAADLDSPTQGVHDFLRAYYHVKSADWASNRPHPLDSWRAEELAKMPTYYVMRLHETMPQTVAHEMPDRSIVAACTWLTETELAVYASEYARTGFAGALRFYQCRIGGSYARELAGFAGRRIEVPACFVSGAQDWGPHQKAGSLAEMRDVACSRMSPIVWIEGAGHWVQQERPVETANAILAFLAAV